MSNFSNITSLGDAKYRGGTYNNIKILGETKFTGDTTCNGFTIMGECEVEGTLTADSMNIIGECKIVNIKTDKCKVAGELNVENNFFSGNTSILGEVSVKGDSTISDLKLTGAIDVKGNLSGDNIKCLGELNVDKDCSFDRFSSLGEVNIKGLLSSDYIEIDSRSECNINEIGAEKVFIVKKSLDIGFGIFSIKSSFGRVMSDSEIKINNIDADDVVLTDTKCNTINARRVRILEGCRIKRIEYTDTIEIHPSSKVDELIKS